MNRLILRSAFFILLLSTACMNKHELKAEKDLTAAIPFVSEPPEAKSMKLNLEKSSIRWKGTKMLGTAGHEGRVDIREGFLLLQNDSLVGGKVVADMHTIRITGKSDYKEADMRRLSNYLKKRALAAEKYPLASFVLNQVKYLGGDSLRVRGTMSVRDVSKNISFPAVIKRSGKNQEFYAELTMDRFEWNVGVEGNLLEVNLVDKEFKLMINLMAGEELIQARPPQ